jgi:hypothetical protein
MEFMFIKFGESTIVRLQYYKLLKPNVWFTKDIRNSKTHFITHFRIQVLIGFVPIQLL